MFKEGDIIHFNERGKEYFANQMWHSGAKELWTKTPYFTVENVCKAFEDRDTAGRNQLGINVFDSYRQMYYSFTESELEIFCKLYIEPFEIEYVEI